MSERSGLFPTPKHPVLSLAVQAGSVPTRQRQTQFEVLVRHLLHRFFHNELLGSDDDESKRIILLSAAAALPGLLVALFLFPRYHAFPPAPLHRLFWSQVGDHYFYVTYPFVILGIATVYEWDLLFPDLLDVFVLSHLPIPMRRLFCARVLALAIFLALVLLGTNVLGMLFFPMIAELPNIGRHFLAHTVAAGMSGGFAATTFLALQGILRNTLGERLFRRITPLLQGASLMALLAVLLVFPMVSASLQPLLTANIAAVRLFPPFWFLGIYERILAGPAAPPIFHALARSGAWAMLLSIACALLTYPLAYRRRVRQLIEGASFLPKTSRTAGPIQRFLHDRILLLPAQRAIFHFISQTILRNQRQRVMLAMYAGLGIAIAVSEMLALHSSAGHMRLALLPQGIRSAVPIMAFWTVASLSSVLAAPVDRRGAWLFQVLLGRPRADHLAGARIWITLWALLISLGTVSSFTHSHPPACEAPRPQQLNYCSPSASPSCSPTSSSCVFARSRSRTCGRDPSPIFHSESCAILSFFPSSLPSWLVRSRGSKRTLLIFSASLASSAVSIFSFFIPMRARLREPRGTYRPTMSMIFLRA